MLDQIKNYFTENGLGLLGSVAASVATGNPAPLIAKVASTLGTDPTEEAVANELSKNNPETLLKLKQLESDERVELERMRLENLTAQISAVNETMRTEANAEHWATYTWRPFIGFQFGFYIMAQWVLPLFKYVAPTIDPTLVTATGAILGVTAWHRGQMQVHKSKK